MNRTIKIRLRRPWLAALLLIGCLPLAAQESKLYREGSNWVQESSGFLNSSSGVRSVRVSTEVGAVTVQGAAQANLTFTIRQKVAAASEQEARRQFSRNRFTAQLRGTVAWLTGEAEGNFRNYSAEIQVRVPRDLAALLIETQGGSVAVRSVNGRVNVETLGGTLSLDTLTGPVVASTAGGNIRVANVGDVKLETGGGNIEVQSATGRVSAESGGGALHITSSNEATTARTGGGDIRMDRCGGAFSAETGGGSIEVAEVNGDASLETAGGNIRVGAARGTVRAFSGGGTIQLFKVLNGIMAETGAGAVTAEFIGHRGSFVASQIHSGAGDIVVYLPADLPVTIRARANAAMGTGIRSDFSELKVASEGGGYGPREVTATGALNGGGPVLQLETNLGTIEIRRVRR